MGQSAKRGELHSATWKAMVNGHASVIFMVSIMALCYRLGAASDNERLVRKAA